MGNKKVNLSAKLVLLLLIQMVMLCSCGSKSDIDEISAPVWEDIPAAVTETDDSLKSDSGIDELSDEQALSATINYCVTLNPTLEEIANAEEYPVYWEIVSSDENEIVVLFRSYTGAQTRYYIDRIMGDTYVTEFVPGVFDEEQRTDESFNIRDYCE